jgi:diguanylate cyclase (GGDEF)-like protein
MSGDTRRPNRIVVVDDNRFTRELAREALEALARVECCESAEAALAALAREPADLVVSDLTMPGLSGLELLERVRREQPGTDFVLFTANASVESAIGALRMGAADYLVKPVQPEELTLVAERILARRALLDENARLRDALHTAEACRTLVRCLDPGEIYAVALDLLLHRLGRARGMSLFRRTAIPMSDGMAFRGFDEEQARVLRGLLADLKPIEPGSLGELEVIRGAALVDSLAAIGLAPGALLSIPVAGRDSEAGVLWIFEDGRGFSADEIACARLIAAHADLALTNAERYHRAKERAFIDDVTEVYNARFLRQAIEHEIQRAERYGKQLCVLFLDLDRFKLVNDQHGHLVGSQVLRRLSEVLQQCIRQVDTLARYGGDEFTILLVDTGIEEGLAVGERIRRTVAATPFEGGRGTPIRLTLSVGVAAYPTHGREHEGLLDLADKAMYRAKSLGRNCVCSAADLGA